MRQAVFTCAAVLLAAGTAARGQWTVINLHPEGASQSVAYGISGGHQVGHVDHHASVWSGTAGSWVDLGEMAEAFGVSGDQQAGRIEIKDSEGYPLWHASAWNGTAASWVDLGLGMAFGASGARQVGWRAVPMPDGYSYQHASVWSGSAASWVDLHPEGDYQSIAWGASGGSQVGYSIVITGDKAHMYACLWSGSAASVVNLHPSGPSDSEAYGAFGGQQVGAVRWDFHSDYGHASLWKGTAASWVDLHPPGWAGSAALGVWDGQQVGTVTGGGGFRASLWRGAAASWVDLHAFLPADFSSSQAHGIWSDAGGTYVAGHGYNQTTKREEALMWVGPGHSLERTVGAWAFDEGALGSPASGDKSILDSSGFSHDGTPMAGPVYAAGSDLGSALSLDFDGVDDFVFINDAVDFQITDSLTLEASVSIRSHTSKSRVVFRGDDRGANDPYSLFIESSGRPRFEINTADGQSAWLRGPVLPTDRWVHLAGSLDDTTGRMRLFVNGLEVNAGTTEKRPFGPLDAAQKPGVSIGNLQSTTFAEYFDGLIDDVRITHGVVSPCDLLRACRADFNCDATLNINDYIAFQSGWRKKEAKADFNRDGKWTINDFIAFQAEFRKGC